MTNLTSCLSKPLNILHMLFIESSCHQNLFGMNKFQIDWLDLVLIVSSNGSKQNKSDAFCIQCMYEFSL